MRFLLCRTDSSTQYAISDPMAARLSSIASQSGGDNVVLMNRLLDLREIFPAELAGHAGFRSELLGMLERLSSLGARQTIKLVA
jgi:fructuronate reductase